MASQSAGNPLSPPSPLVAPSSADPCPDPAPAHGPGPPISPLSSLSAPLPSFWSAARVRESLPAITLSCFTDSEATVDMILCARPPTDPLIYALEMSLGPSERCRGLCSL